MCSPWNTVAMPLACIKEIFSFLKLSSSQERPGFFLSLRDFKPCLTFPEKSCSVAFKDPSRSMSFDEFRQVPGWVELNQGLNIKSRWLVMRLLCKKWGSRIACFFSSLCLWTFRSRFGLTDPSRSALSRALRPLEEKGLLSNPTYLPAPQKKKKTLPKKHIFLRQSVLFSFQECNTGFQIPLETTSPIFRYGRACGNLFFFFFKFPLIFSYCEILIFVWFF